MCCYFRLNLVAILFDHDGMFLKFLSQATVAFVRQIFGRVTTKYRSRLNDSANIFGHAFLGFDSFWYL